MPFMNHISMNNNMTVETVEEEESSGLQSSLVVEMGQTSRYSIQAVNPIEGRATCLVS